MPPPDGRSGGVPGVAGGGDDRLEQDYAAPPEKVFAYLAEHEKMGHTADGQNPPKH